MLKIKKINDRHAGEGMRKAKHLFITSGSTNWDSHYRNNVDVSHKR